MIFKFQFAYSKSYKVLVNKINFTMKKQIFATIPQSPKQKQLPYKTSKEFLKYQSYTNNLSQKINGAISSQSKVIKRKQISFQNQLNFLKEKYYKQSQKLRKMEEYFLMNCQNILKQDIDKWTNNQTFFNDMVNQYERQIEIHKKINAKNKQNAKKLKQQLKFALKQIFLLQLNQSKIQAPKRQKKPSLYLKTESIEPSTTQESQMTKRKVELFSNFFQVQKKTRQTRIKTESSLPKLRKTANDKQKLQVGQISYMKPIGIVKKVQKQYFNLDLMVQILKQYRSETIKEEDSNNWYQKLIFNTRNFEKIVVYFQSLKTNVNEKQSKKSVFGSRQKSKSQKKAYTQM